MPLLDSCPECSRYLCKIKTSSGMDRANWETLLTSHQVRDHRNQVATLFPGQVVRTDKPKVRKP